MREEATHAIPVCRVSRVAGGAGGPVRLAKSSLEPSIRCCCPEQAAAYQERQEGQFLADRSGRRSTPSLGAIPLVVVLLLPIFVLSCVSIPRGMPWVLYYLSMCSRDLSNLIFPFTRTSMLACRALRLTELKFFLVSRLASLSTIVWVFPCSDIPLSHYNMACCVYGQSVSPAAKIAFHAPNPRPRSTHSKPPGQGTSRPPSLATARHSEAPAQQRRTQSTRRGLSISQETSQSQSSS